MLAGYLLNEGNTFWGKEVLWGGLALIICIAFSGKKERAKTRESEENREWMQEADLDGSIFDDD